MKAIRFSIKMNEVPNFENRERIRSKSILNKTMTLDDAAHLTDSAQFHEKQIKVKYYRNNQFHGITNDGCSQADLLKLVEFLIQSDSSITGHLFRIFYHATQFHPYSLTTMKEKLIFQRFCNAILSAANNFVLFYKSFIKFTVV